MCKLTSMVDSGMQSRFLPPNISLSGSSLSNLLDVKPDDNIIITAGVPFGNAGSTNLLRITKIIADKNLN